MPITDRNATLQKLGGTQALPALPYVAHDILVATSSNDVDIGDVAQTLARDPGVAARVIAIANYAFFTRRETVYSLEQAVMRIGLNRVRVLATSMLLNQVFDTRPCSAFQLQRYWHEALGTAFCAARLSPRTAPQHSRDAAYLGGVLHSIGLLLLVNIFPQSMGTVLAEHDEDPERSLAALTYQAIGCNYGEAGELLLREWEIPEPITATAGNAHDRDYAGPHAELVETVRFAHEWLQTGFQVDPVPLAPPAGVKDLERTAEACREEYEALAAFAQLLSEPG